MNRITNLMRAHMWMDTRLDITSIVYDMTCGNGHDTLFLAERCRHVYAVDIQPQAIENTKKRTASFTNITYICKDHSTLVFDDNTHIDGAIYNLGYLPSGDKKIITRTDTTLSSLKSIYPHLSSFLVISCYPGHENGDSEARAVAEWIKELNVPVEEYTYDTPNSPITYCIDLAYASKAA